MSLPNARTARGVDLRVSRTQWPLAGHSGDFAEVKRHEDGALTVVLADVCGNGDEVAGFAKRVRRHVRTALRCFDLPGALFSIVGDVLHSEMPLDAFVAAVGIHIDATGRTMHAATAGHLGPFLRRGRTVLSCLSTTSGPPLGIFKSVEYREVVCPLASNDVVICATDGVSDQFATNEDGTGELGLRARIAELPSPRRAGDLHDIDDLCRRLLWSAARPDTDATVLAVAIRAFHAATFAATSAAGEITHAAKRRLEQSPSPSEWLHARRSARGFDSRRDVHRILGARASPSTIVAFYGNRPRAERGAAG